METIEINTITELHDFYNICKPKHPLITVVDLAAVDRSGRTGKAISYKFNMYIISCKRFKGEMTYGRSTYDFSEGTMMFTAPYQIISPEPGICDITGWCIYIHPDFFRGKSLSHYSFFGYDTNEALHISDTETHILRECVSNIEKEISQNMDKHTHNLIISNIELLLTYCSRFYDRQFLTRTTINNDLVQNFDRLLTDYFDNETPIGKGLPDVGYFAARLHLSPNYLSDLLNKHTGKSTQEHIHLKLIDKAKSLLWNTEKSISEIAYDLGFEYPSYFTKLFKSKLGVSPKEFRNAS
ncbi:MAG: AraC family transcriptional regulator [Bacteroidetes bacterium]|nr:AraC family transcriptional regulator [Bacteroidota bacterium]